MYTQQDSMLWVYMCREKRVGDSIWKELLRSHRKPGIKTFEIVDLGLYVSLVSIKYICYQIFKNIYLGRYRR